MSTATFSQKVKVETFRKRVDLAIPPDDPKLTGFINVNYKVKSKPEVIELSKRNLTDEEYFAEIVVSIEGLGDPKDPEKALEGEAATTEALTGGISMFLVPAIVQTYFETYGEARRGNSKPRR